MLAAEDAKLLQQLAECAAIQQVAYRDITALDTRDADLNVRVLRKMLNVEDHSYIPIFPHHPNGSICRRVCSRTSCA